MLNLFQKSDSFFWTIFFSNRNKTLIGNRYFLEPLYFYKKNVVSKSKLIHLVKKLIHLVRKLIQLLRKLIHLVRKLIHLISKEDINRY